MLTGVRGILICMQLGARTGIRGFRPGLGGRWGTRLGGGAPKESTGGLHGLRLKAVVEVH